MSQTQNAAIAVVGIDIGKNSFHIVGHDQRGVHAQVKVNTAFLVGERYGRLSTPCLRT